MLRLSLFGVAALVQTPMPANVYTVIVDDARRPLGANATGPWTFNATGGDRGVIDSQATVNRFTHPTAVGYRAECVAVNDGSAPTYLGFWESLNRPIAQRHAFSPHAIFSRLIRPEYQGRLLSVEVDVNALGSPASRSDLTLALECRGWDAAGGEVVRHVTALRGRRELFAEPYPRTLSLPIDPGLTAPIGVLNVILENTVAGDVLAIGEIRARVEIPGLDPKIEPFLFAYANLLAMYDETTGLVQDRANYTDGRVENISATGKLAKVIAAAVKLGVTDRLTGTAAINQIASALLTRVPLGPAGLWPHFTMRGGTEILPGTEWASGDTAYALLDLTVALRMVDDPGNYLTLCRERLTSIDWAALYRPGQGYSHGYEQDGRPLPGYWAGFGVETLGVNLAALAGGAPAAPMASPESDNGSGFILHAAYPLAPVGVDRWGNDWQALRRAEVAGQLSWYTTHPHANPFLAVRGWFGLSAAERPEGWDSDHTGIYRAYGIGGRLADAVDDGHSVVTLHYSGSVAALAPEASLAMWNSLKADGLVSPMNLVESLAVNPASGALEHVNFLKGSWNLALFAEGWATAHDDVSRSLNEAVRAIPPLARAWSTLFPDGATPTNYVASAAELEIRSPDAARSTPPGPPHHFTVPPPEVAVAVKFRHRPTSGARGEA
jgi:hypothetical protein